MATEWTDISEQTTTWTYPTEAVASVYGSGIYGAGVYGGQKTQWSDVTENNSCTWSDVE